MTRAPVLRRARQPGGADGAQAPRPVPYRGRFAPSPTGPLHFGSLVAAVGSFLQARAARGAWLVRIDDLDSPRAVPGAADDILRTLAALGLHWDEPVLYQSRRESAYREALERLTRAGWVYPCGCSRREIADSSLTGNDGPIYPGTCRAGVPPGRAARAWRVRTQGAVVELRDRWQGTVRRALETEAGDFVVRRADGPYAYQLAAVVDDAAQGVTEVVRGADLLESSVRQTHLQRLLGLPTPAYAHLPVAVDGTGCKLGKQTGAAPVDARRPVPLICRVLEFLGQPVPADVRALGLEDLWRWASAHWQPERVPRVRSVAIG